MTNLSVELIRGEEELHDAAPAWNGLAGDVPFRAAYWQLPWWDTYGVPSGFFDATRALCVLAVRRKGRLVGLAPWYLELSPLWGRVWKQLGSGEVCSDYLTLPAEPGREAEVGRAVAEYLCDALRGRWDRLDLDGADSRDPALASLVTRLTELGASLERRPGPNCWRLPLPATFDEYLGRCSKSHRKQMRRLMRDVLDTPRARWRTAHTLDEFQELWPLFVDLHQRRRRSLGEPGCFQSPRFKAFHKKTAVGLLVRGALRLHVLEVDGRPLAAEYHVAAGRTIYAYQSGVDPDRLDEEPGRLAGIAVIRQAIAEGYETYDLLRGDEPYKAHWRAVSTPTEQITVVNPRPASRARFTVHQLLRRAKHAVLGAPAATATVASTAGERGANDAPADSKSICESSR